MNHAALAQQLIYGIHGGPAGPPVFEGGKSDATHSHGD